MKLLYYALKYQGEYSKIKKAIDNNEPFETIHYSGNYVTIEDENYPSALLKLENPPYVLFYKGDLSILNKSCITVVGSRKCDVESIQLVNVLTKNLQTVFISGLALGVDGYVHHYAKHSIGVIGCGINRVYPLKNQYLYDKVELLISEYPDNTPPLKHHFPMRNRIMVALSKALIVVECQIASGTMTSVLIALNLGIDVYVFPKSFFALNNGNNQLIKEGAIPLVSIQDIIELDLDN